MWAFRILWVAAPKLCRYECAMTRKGQGYLFTLLAVTIFATQDGISKYLGTHYSPILITMIRYWVFAAFVLLLAIRSGGIAKAAATKRPFYRFFAASCLLLKSLHSYSPSVARAWQRHNRSFRAHRYW